MQGRILITGATGTLGRDLIDVAVDRGHAVRAQSRRPQAPQDRVEWVVADLETGEGLEAATAGIDTIIHCASDSRRAAQVDVDGTRHLIEAAQSHGVRHVLYVSIVGIDRIPFPYYEAKLEAERRITSGAVPWSILRATQFHSLIEGMIRKAARVPLLMPLPHGIRFQSVAVREVAERIIEATGAGPAGRLPDFGGPETMTLIHAARIWKRVTRRRKAIVPIPAPGAFARALREGRNTTTSCEKGTIRWESWLRSRPHPENPPERLSARHAEKE